MGELAVVILAAGAATRFGSAKQLAKFQGKTLIGRAIETALADHPRDSYLVLGAHSSEIAPLVDSMPIGIIENPEWNEGIGASIRTAVKQLQNRYRALLFLAVDQVEINAASLRKLTAQWQRHPIKIIAAQYNNTLGIPAIFPARFFPDLLALQGDRGAKQIIRKHRHEAEAVALPEASRDIDKVTDLSSC